MKIFYSFLLLINYVAYAAVPASNAKFLKPEEAIAKMDIPEGFEVKTFVSEPDIGETIAFCFDDKGRLWTLENFNYYNRKSHTTKKNLNRIQIFEDTDGNGVFDTKKLFMDGLGFSSGIAVGHGGVFVGSPPNLVFIPDADGDDKPDSKPEVLLDGWGIQDRHETLNSFIWGQDGWLYGCHGVFTKSNVAKPGTPKEDRQFIDGGIWRWHPERKEFEVFTRGLSNPWGFDFNNVGEGFATCCVIPHLFHIVQGGNYDKQGKRYINPHIYDKIQTCRDHRHKSAHGGARFYLADAFPKKYHEQLFMCNIHEHAVLTDYMVPKGSGYIGKHGEDFLPTNYKAWVGFSVEVGPEGAVYILDWHDQDICGNSIRFPNSARVYRILPKGKKGVTNIDLRAMSDEKLVELQMHANDWYVRHARTILHERAINGKLKKSSVHKALFKMLDTAPNIGKKLRALWALHVTGALKENSSAALMKTLKHQEEMIRAWSVQLLCEEKNPSDEAIKEFTKMAKEDKSPKVRLYLASALQRIPVQKRWNILKGLVSHGEDEKDHNIAKLIWTALEGMVLENPEKSLVLAASSKLPSIQQFVPRRLLSNTQDSVKNDTKKLNSSLKRIAPGFKLVNNNWDEAGKFMKSFRNKAVIMTHPLNQNTPSFLVRHIKIPEGKKSSLKLLVSHRPHYDWRLNVLINEKKVFSDLVSSNTTKEGWMSKEIDLSKYAGQKIQIKLENEANNWAFEHGYWSSVKIISE